MPVTATRARVQLKNGYATFQIMGDDEVSEYFNKIRALQDTSFNEKTYKEQQRIMTRRKYGNQAAARPLNDSHAWDRYSI